MNVAPDSDSDLPISRSHDPLDLLFRTRLLDPPSHPSLLACLDHYEILDWIGSGGMGIVFLARSRRKLTPKEEMADFLDLPGQQEETGPREGGSGVSQLAQEPGRELVAIKLLRPELISNIEAVDRFLLEARHMQNLFHPNILQVLEVCDRSHSSPARPSSMPVFRSRRPFFVTPYVEGGNLAKRIRVMGPLPLELVLPIARQIASALCYVHGKGIVHRDLKPGNILLGTADHVFLADFGLARTFTNESVAHGRRSQCVGTSCYMSPALAAGEAEDTRGDIYAFGAILYEMLSGRAPFAETTPVETLQRILAGPPAPISQVNPGADGDLIRVAEGAMARKIRDRYSSMTDILADLERMSHGALPHGPHGHEKIPSSVTLPEKNRSKRVSAGVWAVIALLAISLMGLIFWLDAEHLKMTGRHELPGVLHWQDAQLVEWNGTPPKELMLIQKEELIVLSDLGPLVRQPHLLAAFQPAPAVDLSWDMDNDHLDELFIRWADSESMHLAVINHQFKILKHFQFAVEDRGIIPAMSHQARLRSKRVLDLDRDGQRELLAAADGDTNSSWNGVVCFNFENNSLRWSFPVPLNPLALQCIDLDGDGSLEIVVGGSRPKGLSPSPAPRERILALSSQGQRLWGALGDMTEEVLCPMAVNLNQDKVSEIIAWSPPFQDPTFEPPSSPRVYYLNHLGSLTAQFRADAPITGAVICRGGRTDPACLIVSDASGQVYQLGDRLVPQRKRHLIDPRAGSLRVAASADLNSDQRDEIILVEQESANRLMPLTTSIIILSSTLEMVSRCQLPGSFESSPAILVTDWDGNRELEILVLGGEVLVLRMEGGR